jgi:hypothetical protein
VGVVLAVTNRGLISADGRGVIFLFIVYNTAESLRLARYSANSFKGLARSDRWQRSDVPFIIISFFDFLCLGFWFLHLLPNQTQISSMKHEGFIDAVSKFFVKALCQRAYLFSLGVDIDGFQFQIGHT